jgi:ribosome-associated translation inhibitor RaiA
MDQELNDLKVDIAIIKKDIKQIERFFDKVDHVVDEMSEVAKMIAVQQQLLANFEQKLAYSERAGIEGRMALKDQLDEFKQDFVDDMSGRVSDAAKEHENLAMELKLWNEKRHTQIIASFDKVSDEIESRVRKLEQSKWYALGMVAVVVFLFGTGSELLSIFG